MLRVVRPFLGRLRQIWEDLRSSLWFVPTLLVSGGLVLAAVLIEAESLVERERLTSRWPRLFGAGAEGARGMLEAIASSMITVAGVAFSITIVTFALASSQYTSRVLRNFMRDRSNQMVLGVFLGVFAYCLVVLRTIRGGEEDGSYVPSVAVLMAVLLALVAIGFLVFFIHHIAASIQASNLIHGAAQETIGAVDRQFPEQEKASEEATQPSREPSEGTWSIVPARTTGYIQAVDVGTLNDLADKHEVVIKLQRGLGEFAIEATPLGLVSGQLPDERFVREVNAACTFGRSRTVQQDAAFGIRQIVDIALKALSPGINDTTTAVICIDHLGAILVRLAPRHLARSEAEDRERTRVMLPRPTYAGLLGEAFDEIRQNAEGNVTILTRLLQIMEIVAAETKSSSRRRELMEQAVLVAEAAERTVPSVRDREGIKAVMERVVKALSVTDQTRGA